MSPLPRTLCLASGSPRRRELLARAGLLPCVCPAHATEVFAPGPIGAAIETLAEAKLRAAWSRWAPEGAISDLLWLAADTAVVAGETVYGKPGDAEEAARTLRSLAGRTHEVITGFVLGRDGQVVHRSHVRTKVTMRPFAEAELQRYVASGEPFDKAGAYAVQGLGGALVERLDGSLSNVVGLPLQEVLVALAQATPAPGAR